MPSVRQELGQIDGVSIGGSGTWALRFPEDFDDTNARVVRVFEQGFDTPYGRSAPFKLLDVHGGRILRVAFHGVPRERMAETVPIDECALQVSYVIHEADAPWVVADASVGGIKAPGTENDPLPPWSIVIPDDFWGVNMPEEFLKEAERSTGRLTGKRGIAMLGEPFHPDLRQALHDAALLHFERVHLNGNYLCAPVGIFPGAAEIEAYRRLDMDVMGRTFAFEAILARVYGYPIAAMNIVSNSTAGRAKGDESGMGDFYQRCAKPMAQATIDAIRLILERAPDPDFVRRHRPWDASPYPVPGA